MIYKKNPISFTLGYISSLSPWLPSFHHPSAFYFLLALPAWILRRIYTVHFFLSSWMNDLIRSQWKFHWISYLSFINFRYIWCIYSLSNPRREPSVIAGSKIYQARTLLLYSVYFYKSSILAQCGRINWSAPKMSTVLISLAPAASSGMKPRRASPVSPFALTPASRSGIVVPLN